MENLSNQRIHITDTMQLKTWHLNHAAESCTAVAQALPGTRAHDATRVSSAWTAVCTGDLIVGHVNAFKIKTGFGSENI